MKYLSGYEVDGHYYRLWRIVFCKTTFNNFFYGQGTARKIVWRFYWITPFKQHRSN